MAENLYVNSFKRKVLGVFALIFGALWAPMAFGQATPCNYTVDSSGFIFGQDTVSSVTVDAAPLSLSGLPYTDLNVLVADMQAAPLSYAVTTTADANGLIDSITVNGTLDQFQSIGITKLDGTIENVPFVQDCVGGGGGNPLVEKTSDPASNTLVSIGETVEYTMNITAYRDYATFIIQDPLPDEAILVGISGYTQANMDAPTTAITTDPITGQDVLNITISNLLAGISEVSFQVQVVTIGDSTLTNQISLAYGQTAAGVVDTADISGVISHPIGAANLAVHKSSPTAGQSVMPGQTVDYTFTIETLRPYHRVVISDFLPVGITFDEVLSYTGIADAPYTNVVTDPNDGRQMLQVIADNPPVGTSTIGFRVNITQNAVAGTLRNTIHIAHGEHDDMGIEPALDTGSPVEHTFMTPDVEVLKFSSANGGPVEIGERITYTIRLVNHSAAPIYDIIVRDNMPFELSYISGDPEVFPPTFGATGQIISIQLFELGAGEIKDIDFVVELDELPNNFELNNKIQNALAYKNPGFLNPAVVSFDADGVTDEVNPTGPAAMITITPQLGNERVDPFEEITYSVLVQNVGTQRLSNNIVTFARPAYLDFVSTSATVINAGTQTMQFDLQEIDPGVSKSFSLQLRPNGQALALNTAADGFIDLVSTVTLASNQTLNPAPTSTAIVELRPPTFTVQKRAVSSRVEPLLENDTIEYTIEVVPNVAQSLDMITITDVLQNDLEFVAGSGSAGVSGNGQVITAVFTNVTSPQSKVFTAKVASIPQNNQVCNGIANVSATASGVAVVGNTIVDRACFSVVDSVSTYSVTKKSTPAAGTNVNVGENVEYSVEFTNLSGSTITNYEIVDSLATEASFVSFSVDAPTGGNASMTQIGGNQLEIMFSNVPTGATVKANYIVAVNSVPANPTGSLCNEINEQNVPAGLLGSILIDKVCHSVNNSAGGGGNTDDGFNVAKSTTTSGTIGLGSTIDYQITAEALTSTSVLGVTVIDLLPSEVTFVSGDAGISHNNGIVSATFPVVSQVPTILNYTVQLTSIPASGSFTNTLLSAFGYIPTAGSLQTQVISGGGASGSGDGVNGNITNGSVTLNVGQTGGSGFECGLTSSSAGQNVVLSDQIPFSVHCTADSDTVSMINAVVSLPSGLTYLSGDANITPNGQNITLTMGPVTTSGTTMNFIAQVASAPVSGSIYTSVLASAQDQNNQNGNINPANSVHVYESGSNGGGNATVSVKKTAIPAEETMIAPGDTLQYVIEVEVPTGKTYESILVQDFLPPEISFGTGGTGITQSATDAQLIEILFENVSAGTYQKTFTANLSATTTMNRICNTLLGVDVVENGVSGSGSLENSSVCHNVGAAAPDFSVLKSSIVNGEEIPANMPFVYTLSVENTGTTDLSQVKITDILPTGWAFVSGQGATVTELTNNEVRIDFGVLSLSSTETAEITVKSTVVNASQTCNAEPNLQISALYGADSVTPSEVLGQVCVITTEESDGTSSSISGSTATSGVPSDDFEIELSANYGHDARISGSPVVNYIVKVTNNTLTDVSDVISLVPLDSRISFIGSDAANITFPSAGAMDSVEILFADLAAGETKTANFNVQFPEMFGGTIITHQASATGVQNGVRFMPVYSNNHTIKGNVVIAPEGDNSGGESETNEPETERVLTIPDTEVAGRNNIEEVFDPEKPLCAPVICPACMKASRLAIDKKVFDASPAVNAWTDYAPVAYGQEVKYKVDLELQVQNAQNYDLTNGQIYFYDVTEPMTDAGFNGIYGRVLETGGQPWRTTAENANRFRVELREVIQDGLVGIDVLNEGLVLEVPIEYSMRSDLVATTDFGIGVENVAFAVIILEFTDTDNDVQHYHVATFGDGTPIDADQCENPITAQMLSSLVDEDAESFATYGSEAKVDIFRPLVAARAGSVLTVDTNKEGNRLFATEIPVERVKKDFRDQVVYSDANENETSNEIATLKEIQEQLQDGEDFLTQLRETSVITTDLASFFPAESADGAIRKAPGQNVFFFEGDELVLSGTYAINKPITVVIPNGDVIIAENVEFPVSLPAFVLQNGDMYVEKRVEKIDGVYVLQETTTSEVRSYDAFEEDDISAKPLAWTGLLLGGNPEHLFEKRIYLGENPSATPEDGGGIEPSVQFVFDDRLTTEEIPVLVDILGEGWQQSVR